MSATATARTLAALLTRRDLQPAAQCFAHACKLSREHSEFAAYALQTYGAHGPDISGCVRDHFPHGTREHLRGLARVIPNWSDAAYREKPRGVRAATMRALAAAVATRDGCGFYGPAAHGDDVRRALASILAARAASIGA